MKNKRIIPILLPLFLIFANELFLVYPKALFVSMALGVLAIVLAAKAIGASNKEKFWLPLALLPSLVFFSFSLYAALASQPILIQFSIFLSAVLVFYYFKNLYYYLIADDNNRLPKLDSFSVLAGILVVFVLCSSIYALPSFIKTDLNLLLVFLMPITYFLFVQPAVFNHSNFKSNIAISLVCTLIFSEMSWVFSLFPFHPEMLGIFSSLTYYLLLIVSRLSLKGGLNRRSLKWPLILVAMASVALLLTARWL